MYGVISYHLKTDTSFGTLYFFFFRLLWLKTSKTMLNKSGESGHPCLVPDLRGNASSFPPLSMMLAVGSEMVFYIFILLLLSTSI